MRTVDKEDVEMLQTVIANAGLDQMKYVGRGRDAECVAIKVPSSCSELSIAADLADATQGDIEQLDIVTHALRSALVDGLGTGSVIYFPHYEVA